VCGDVTVLVDCSRNGGNRHLLLCGDVCSREGATVNIFFFAGISLFARSNSETIFFCAGMFTVRARMGYARLGVATVDDSLSRNL
jgi:hypothetical protein